MEPISGTFILPPNPGHSALLDELRAASKSPGITSVRNYGITSMEALAILTLADELRPFDRDTLLSKPLDAMVSISLRCMDVGT